MASGVAAGPILRRRIDSPGRQANGARGPKWSNQTWLPAGTTSHFAISIWSWRRGRAAKTDAPPSGSLMSNSILPIMWKSLPYGWVPCGNPEWDPFLLRAEIARGAREMVLQFPRRVVKGEGRRIRSGIPSAVLPRKKANITHEVRFYQGARLPRIGRRPGRKGANSEVPALKRPGLTTSGLDRANILALKLSPSTSAAQAVLASEQALA